VRFTNQYRLVFSNGTILGPRMGTEGYVELLRAWDVNRRPSGAFVQHRLEVDATVDPWTTVWAANQDHYLVALDRLRARLARYAEVALRQAQNLADYGCEDPTGGRGVQQYPINHPLFPMQETGHESASP
jgi:hypothetical protein